MSDTTIFGCGFLGNQRQFTSSEKRLATVNLKKFGDEKGGTLLLLWYLRKARDAINTKIKKTSHLFG